jgi:hypothetical protein
MSSGEPENAGFLRRAVKAIVYGFASSLLVFFFAQFLAWIGLGHAVRAITEETRPALKALQPYSLAAKYYELFKQADTWPHCAATPSERGDWGICVVRMPGHPSVQQTLRNRYYESLGLLRINAPASCEPIRAKFGALEAPTEKRDEPPICEFPRIPLPAPPDSPEFCCSQEGTRRGLRDMRTNVYTVGNARCFFADRTPEYSDHCAPCFGSVDI